MVVLKPSRELKAMREAGRISANALKLAGEAVEPGITTWEIDEIVRKYIEGQGAVPSFLGYGGFPASACISVNNVVIHGIPSKKCVVKKGDIVSIDIGAHFNGFHGDNAWTFPCGDISEEARALLDATREPHRRYRQRGSKVCRSAQLLCGTRFCRPWRRCEAA